MPKKLSLPFLKTFIQQIDWKLLLFVLMFTDVKLVVKIAAIIIIYLVRPNLKLKLLENSSRPLLFYISLIAIALCNAIIYHSFGSTSNTISIITGIGFWILCILAFQQLRPAIETNDSEVLHNTMLVFFSINILFSLINLGSIILETGHLNPYRYQGNYQKYFIGTGDYIRGLSFDTSTTNAVINSFALVYFLKRDNALLVILTMAVLLLTGSNFTNLILLSTLVFLFLFRSTANQKSMVVVCAAMLVIFLSKVSPQNDNYVSDGFNKFFLHKKPATHEAALFVPITQRPDSSLSADEKMQKVAQLFLDSLDHIAIKEKTIDAQIGALKPVIPTPSIHSVPFQRKHDTSEVQRDLLTFVTTNNLSLSKTETTDNSKAHPGKLTAAKQTIDFFKAHPFKIINGNGIGNFSSKLAFRSAALNIAGGYPLKYRYINEDFKYNHLSLFLSYFTGDKEKHSIINSPNSTYDQLLSEYGLLGFAAFLIFYLGFFVSHYKVLTYGIPLLLIICGMFLVDYWFEQLSVVIIFEMLLLLDIKESKQKLQSVNE